MINFGLLRRALREMFPTTLLCAGFLALISCVLAAVLPDFQARTLKSLFVSPAVLQLRNVLLGMDASEGGVSDTAFAVAWSHPVVLILLLAQGVVACTRVPAGEIERGSLDMLLGLPISRRELFLSETMAWAIGGVLTLGAIYAGSFIGARFTLPEYRPHWGRLAMVLVNLGFVYAAVSAAGALASTLSDRRGRAVMVVLVVAVSSLLVNFLELIWESAKQFSFLSFLHYYVPVRMLMNGAWPVHDLVVLGSIALALWVAAWTVMERRALTTL